MSDLTAEHYLGIYNGRLSMAERGIINPSDEAIKFARELVSGLTGLPSETKIRIEVDGDWSRFKVADTGALVAQTKLWAKTSGSD
jgi:hypothetical protein